jgi:tRNA modification GTPase
MINKLSGWDDTIVAIATAPGIGAIAVIRLSGEKAFGTTITYHACWYFKRGCKCN